MEADGTLLEKDSLKRDSYKIMNPDEENEIDDGTAGTMALKLKPNTSI